MKKINVLITIALLFLFGGCSKYEFYDWAINSKRDGSNLELKKIKINDGVIVYLENKNVQKDETLVLVHGFGASKDNWLDLSSELSSKYHLLILDLPGHGESFSIDSKKYTIKNQTTWLKQFIKKKGIKKFTLIGNSMGGAISLEYSELYPTDLNNLVLITTASQLCLGIQSEFSKLVSQGKNPLITNTAKDFEKLLDFIMYERNYVPGPILEVMAEKKNKRKELDEIIFSHIVEELSLNYQKTINIKTKTLIVWGEQDRVINVECANVLEKNITNSKKIVFKEVGHVPQMEVPEKLSEAIQNFIE